MKGIFASLMILVALFAGCKTAQEQQTPNDHWLDLALKSEHFIRQGRYTVNDSVLAWKIMPDSVSSVASTDLYSGVPGIVVFYLELFHATGDSIYLDQALGGSEFLLQALEDSLPGPYEVGLYTGISGIGFVLAEIYNLTGDKKVLNGVMEVLDKLEKSADSSTGSMHWEKINDVVYGSAGIGLFLQYLSDKCALPRAESLSILVAEGLLGTAFDTLGGKRWNFMPGFDRYLDNFSHGTAGVAYFLSQTYLRTKDVKFLEAALDGARLLDSLANKKGYIPHHFPGGEDLYYHSWCHGSPGTSRLYFSLYDATGDRLWLDKIEHASNHLMAEGIDTTELPGLWNNQGRCCGSVGVARHYLWLYQFTGSVSYFEFSEKMTQNVLRYSTEENGTWKWVHAENRVNPEVTAAQTGLMQGSAGMGLWFLQLHAHQNNRNMLVKFPDDLLSSSSL